jgi:hypothetical protein
VGEGIGHHRSLLQDYVITYTGILLILIRHSAQSEIAGQRFAHNAREVPTSDSMVEVRPELVLDAIWNWGEIRTRSGALTRE